MNRLAPIGVVALLISLAISETSSGEVIKYRFTATVQSDLSFISQGDTVSGTFQYDTNDTADSTDFSVGSENRIYTQTAPMAAIELDYQFASGAATQSFSTDPGLTHKYTSIFNYYTH